MSGILASVGIPVDRLFPGACSPLPAIEAPLTAEPLSLSSARVVANLPQSPITSILALKDLLPKKIRDGIADDHQFASGVWMRSMKGIRGIETKEKGQVTGTDFYYLTKNRGEEKTDQLVVFHGQAKGENFTFRVEVYVGFLMHTITFKEEDGEVMPLVSSEVIETGEALTIEDVLPAKAGQRLFSPKLRRIMRGSVFWDGSWLGRAADATVPRVTRDHGKARYTFFDVDQKSGRRPRIITFRQSGEGRDMHLVVEVFDGNTTQRFEHGRMVARAYPAADRQTGLDAFRAEMEARGVDTEIEYDRDTTLPNTSELAASTEVPAARVALEVDLEPPMTYGEFLEMAEDNPLVFGDRAEAPDSVDRKADTPQPSPQAQADFAQVQSALSRMGAWVEDIDDLRSDAWMANPVVRGMIAWLNGAELMTAKMLIRGEEFEVEEFVCTDKTKCEYHFARRKDSGEIVVQVIENPRTKEARVLFFDMVQGFVGEDGKPIERKAPAAAKDAPVQPAEEAAAAAAKPDDRTHEVTETTVKPVGNLEDYLKAILEVLTAQGIDASLIDTREKLLAGDWMDKVSNIDTISTEANGNTYTRRSVSITVGEHAQAVVYTFTQYSGLPLYVQIQEGGGVRTVLELGSRRTIKELPKATPAKAGKVVVATEDDLAVATGKAPAAQPRVETDVDQSAKPSPKVSPRVPAPDRTAEISPLDLARIMKAARWGAPEAVAFLESLGGANSTPVPNSEPVAPAQEGMPANRVDALLAQMMAATPQRDKAGASGNGATSGPAEAEDQEVDPERMPASSLLPPTAEAWTEAERAAQRALLGAQLSANARSGQPVDPGRLPGSLAGQVNPHARRRALGGPRPDTLPRTPGGLVMP
jgi:hypothetical protein